jgi:hypothetical protein
MAEQQVEYQLTPRGKHAHNAAEKGIQSWKDHFLAEISAFSLGQTRRTK